MGTVTVASKIPSEVRDALRREAELRGTSLSTLIAERLSEAAQADGMECIGSRKAEATGNGVRLRMPDDVIAHLRLAAGDHVAFYVVNKAEPRNVILRRL